MNVIFKLLSKTPSGNHMRINFIFDIVANSLGLVLLAKILQFAMFPFRTDVECSLTVKTCQFVIVE